MKPGTSNTTTNFDSIMLEVMVKNGGRMAAFHPGPP